MVSLDRRSWGGGRFNLTIREGGAGGTVIYNFGKNYRGVYDPNPHLAYVGAPLGRGGARRCDGSGHDRQAGVAVAPAATGLREQIV